MSPLEPHARPFPLLYREAEAQLSAISKLLEQSRVSQLAAGLLHATLLYPHPRIRFPQSVLGRYNDYTIRYTTSVAQQRQRAYAGGASTMLLPTARSVSVLERRLLSGEAGVGVVHALHDVFSDFGLPVEAMLSAARSLQQSLTTAKSSTNIALAEVSCCCCSEAKLLPRRSVCLPLSCTVQKGNQIMRFQVMLSLINSALASCMTVSGWFGACDASSLSAQLFYSDLCVGMNIDNGGCGPDGCHGWLAEDHGCVTGATAVAAAAAAPPAALHLVLVQGQALPVDNDHNYERRRPRDRDDVAFHQAKYCRDQRAGERWREAIGVRSLAATK